MVVEGRGSDGNESEQMKYSVNESEQVKYSANESEH